MGKRRKRKGANGNGHNGHNGNGNGNGNGGNGHNGHQTAEADDLAELVQTGTDAVVSVLAAGMSVEGAPISGTMDAARELPAAARIAAALVLFPADLEAQGEHEAAVGMIGKLSPDEHALLVAWLMAIHQTAYEEGIEDGQSGRSRYLEDLGFDYDESGAAPL